MAKREINIELRAAGAGKVAAALGIVGNASKDLIVNVKKMGNVFGELGNNIGGLFQNILKGSVWGIVASIAENVIGLIGKWRDRQKEVAEASKRATEDMIAANAKLTASVRETAKTAEEASKTFISQRDEELKKTNELIKAEIRLKKERAIAAGMKTADAEKWEVEQLRRVDKRAADEAMGNRLLDAEERVARTGSSLDMAKLAWENAEADNQNLKRKYIDAEDAAVKKAIARTEAMLAAVQQDAFNGLSDQQRDEVAASARVEFAKSDKGRELSKAVKEHADKELKDAKKLVKEAEDAATAAEHNLKMVKAEADAYLMKEKSDSYEKKRTEAKNVRDAEIKAAQDAAKERERLDRELHQKRMDALREEIAKQRELAAPLRAVATAAQSEFDRAFAMYRDPEKARAQIAEERDYAADLKQLHKDASRYGGKWRIDELSQLMSAGDTQGVSDRLESWRKSSRFTPEVEAMVRASAAERTKTTAEDELRKLNEQTKNLETALREESKNGTAKLDAIATNTAGLASKLDQLLQVKG